MSRHRLHACLKTSCTALLPVVLLAGCQDRSEEDRPQAGDKTVDKTNERFELTETSRPGETPVATASAPASETEPITSPDEQHRAKVVGTWEDDYQGKRTLTVRADGTATMVVELAGVAAALYAKRMTFEEEWEIEDGVLIMKMLGGEPEKRVNLIMSTMGDSSSQEILELTAERMLLRDLKGDGTKEYDWRRVRDDDPPAQTSRMPLTSEPSGGIDDNRQ